MLTCEWFTVADLVRMKLPGIPATVRGLRDQMQRLGWQHSSLEDVRWRTRTGRGGGIEYHYSLLPATAQAKIAQLYPATNATIMSADIPEQPARVQARWGWFEQQPDTRKQIARERLEILLSWKALIEAGVGRVEAGRELAAKHKISLTTLYNWEDLVSTEHRSNWLAFLAPRHVGRQAEAEIPADAWDMIRADWLRLEAPSFASCWGRLNDAAVERGWKLPSERTVFRRLKALPRPTRVLAREGEEALARMYAPQKRDRSVFHAMEALNVDGHKFDVFVRWPDDKISRPQLVVFQDLYSGKVVGWRADRSLHSDLTRLAFRDVVRDHGLPTHLWADNGREFANKMLTGGTPTRYRFKVKEEDPTGILVALGVEVHWTKPYSGQSKPIERAFRDFAHDIAKHPSFAGAYCGHKVDAKPENYGSKAIPIDQFELVVGAAIAKWNAREGRDTLVCKGRSFDAVFNESIEANAALIRRPTEDQLATLLLAAEKVSADRRSGSISLHGNSFWAPFLAQHAGAKLTVRFDPEQLQDDLRVYRLDGVFLGAAPCTHAVGFNDVDAARAHGRERKAWIRGQKAMLAAEKNMTIAQVAAMLPPPPEPAPVEQKIVRLFSGNVAVQHEAEPEEEEQSEQERRMLNALRTHKGARLRLIEPDEEI